MPQRVKSLSCPHVIQQKNLREPGCNNLGSDILLELKQNHMVFESFVTAFWQIGILLLYN